MLYDWIKALHVISMVAWMAGMLYLPRLFVYHVAAKPGSELSETLKIMERKLLRQIINPAMIATVLFGGTMIFLNPDVMHHPYMHAKLGLVGLMIVVHILLARYRRLFASDQNMHSARYYRILNEVPAVLLFGIVLLIIVKPGP